MAWPGAQEKRVPGENRPTNHPKEAAAVGERQDNPEASPLTIQLFGSFAAFCHGQPLPWLRSRREQWLLAPEDFAAAWAQGRATTCVQAVAFALGEAANA